MATSKLNQFLQVVDEDLVCAICQERFQDPKSLQCLHSFCLSCLENWIKTNNDKLTCPMCCKSYPIPDGGLKKLPPNTFLNNMLENIDKFQKKDNIKCVCGETEQVTDYCKECRHYLCFACSKHHKILPLSSGHTLLAAEEVKSMTPQQLAALNPPLCSSHNKPLELYCTKCKEPICIQCAIITHPSIDHKPIGIGKAFESFQGSAQHLKSAAHHYKVKLENGLKELTENAEKLKESKESSKKDINKQVQESIKIIQKRGDELKKKVDTLYENERKTIDVEMENIRSITAELNTNVSFLKQLIKSELATAMMSNDDEDKSFRVLINKGDADGMVIYRRGVVVDDDDNIIVSSNSKLQLFSSDGCFIKRIDQEGDGINILEQLCIISSNPRRIATMDLGILNSDYGNVTERRSG
ncbi:tripartite motif-containing protein 2-like [Antedon mediterranea]|uniref:tripartite motif-containing protein 2-like n=1 Tax=Antedon mediterranea TaxID=105859 RepID=UPI003AF96E2B